MKVFGNPMSTCTRKVLMTLAEKNQKAELVVLDFAKTDHKQPGFLTKQPFGQMPCLEDDNFTLYESRAICRYLDEKLGGTRLVPTDLKNRALVEQWISVETSNFTPHAMTVLYGAFFGPAFYGKPIDEAKVAEGRTKLEPTLDIMAKQLEKTPFIAGTEFSLADICFMPYVEYLYACKQGDLFERRPALAKWWKGVSDRRSWQTAIGKA